MAKSGATGATRNISIVPMPSSAAPASQAMRMPSPILSTLPMGITLTSEIKTRIFLYPFPVVRITAARHHDGSGCHLHLFSVIVDDDA